MSSSHRTGGDSTRYERVNEIECIVRENDDIVEYIPYKGVFMTFGLIVAAAGEIPEELKNELKRKHSNAVTFSFPSMGVKFGKTDEGEMIAFKSARESLVRANKYYNEALQEAIKSSTSSAMTPSLGSSSSTLRPCTSGMIEVCMNPDMRKMNFIRWLSKLPMWIILWKSFANQWLSCLSSGPMQCTYTMKSSMLYPPS